MDYTDDVARANEALWESEVRRGGGATVPWLDLNVEQLRGFARGEPDGLPEPHEDLYRPLVADVRGKDVLCLPAAGGQHSALFGVLGAKVTVVDIARGQLDGDERAAAHYGYEITTIHGDMRDLSCLAPASFDVVYGTTPCYVPSIREVYAQVARVLRPGGLYRTDVGQPATFVVEWDGAHYCLGVPYRERVLRRDDGGIEFRHYMDDIFNGLRDAGLTLVEVIDCARDHAPPPDAAPGSWTHESGYVGGCFVIVARRNAD